MSAGWESAGDCGIISIVMPSAQTCVNSLFIGTLAVGVTIAQNTALTHAEKDSARLESIEREAEQNAAASIYGLDSVFGGLTRGDVLSSIRGEEELEEEAVTPIGMAVQTDANRSLFEGIKVTSFGEVEDEYRIGVAWSDREKTMSDLELFGTWSLCTNWISLPNRVVSYRRGQTNVVFRVDWEISFSNAVARGLFPGDASLGAAFFMTAWRLDTDDDGITDASERLIYLTDPYRSDTDGDGLSDWSELSYYHTDPRNPDTDGDGMNDGWELENNRDPLVWTDSSGDQDRDGLTDLEESQWGTYPWLDDSDSDQLPDGWEVAHGLHPMDSSGDNGYWGDPDGDGIGNYDEYLNGTDPHVPDPDNLVAADDPEWVDSQVGIAQTNGYYKLLVCFPTAPSTNTVLRVGDRRVFVTEAGEYSFLLEKGVDYTLGIYPENDAVEFQVLDDLRNDPVPASEIGWNSSSGVWSSEGGYLHFEAPANSVLGRLLWLPIICGTPDRSHFGAGSHRRQFSVLLSDCGPSASARYRWSSSDPNITFSSPTSRTTYAEISDLPGWSMAELSVTVTFSDISLTSVLPGMAYGNHREPEVSVAFLGSDHIWVNRPWDESNMRDFRVKIVSDIPTNGVLRVEFIGNSAHVAMNSSGPWQWLVSDFLEMSETNPLILDVASVEGVSASEYCNAEGFSWMFTTSDGDTISGIHYFTVVEVAEVDVWSEKGSASDNPPPFAGQTVCSFDCRSNPVDQHYPIFYSDVVTNDFVIVPYSVEFRVKTNPENFTISGGRTRMVRAQGPQSGTIRTPVGKCGYLDTPSEGGVYKMQVGYEDSPLTDTILLLPLAGASIDDVAIADLDLADETVYYILEHTTYLERQIPSFGLSWFVYDGMGDYWGRVDSSRSPTVWHYNPIDQEAFGAVATWHGIPTRLAKLSNFMVGYTAQRIGVWPILQGASQFVGTSNDQAASMSWGAGVEVADGAPFEFTTANLVTNMWSIAEQKERRLWPNLDPATNYRQRNRITNFNLFFCSPGFMERRIE